MSGYLYYPGCSMESSAVAYHDSLLAISEPLGLELQEIHDWNCCGATEYLGINLIPAYSLISRNLALASQQANGTRSIVAPCSACYLNLAKADHFMLERPVLGVKVNEALAAGGLHYDAGTLEIRHLLDVLINDIGLDKIESQVVKPLTGLRVAPYLGCMVPRPDYEKRWSDFEYPNELDRLLKALGAEVIDFPLKTHCCGGHMTQISPPMAFELIRRLIHGADQYNADVMATALPNVSDEPRCLSGRNQPLFPDELPHADLVFHPTDWPGIRPGPEGSSIRQGAGQCSYGDEPYRRRSPGRRNSEAAETQEENRPANADHAGR